jgi:hypothetical protein
MRSWDGDGFARSVRKPNREPNAMHRLSAAICGQSNHRNGGVSNKFPGSWEMGDGRWELVDGSWGGDGSIVNCAMILIVWH